MLIVGKCDKFGGEQYNKLLGKQRAEAICRIFIPLSISEDIILVAFLGPTKANLSVRSKAEGAFDRRCDVVLQVK
jgi:outer membrane protein OmpA-like peptidoglycan-associated protein